MVAPTTGFFDKLLRFPNFLQKFGKLFLLNAQGNPDVSPAHTPSFRFRRLSGFIDSLSPPGDRRASASEGRRAMPPLQMQKCRTQVGAASCVTETIE